jgi:hypothetical protein
MRNRSGETARHALPDWRVHAGMRRPSRPADRTTTRECSNDGAYFCDARLRRHVQPCLGQSSAMFRSARLTTLPAAFFGRDSAMTSRRGFFNEAR